jgi:hypothetical protein
MCPEPQTRPRPRCRSSTTKARGRARPPDSSDARRDPQDARARDRPVAPASRGTPRGARHNRTRHARRASPRHTPERHASPVKEPPHARSQMEDLLTGRARGPRRRPPEPHHPRNAALTPAGDSTERAFPSHQPRAEPSRRTVLRTVPGDQRTAPHRENQGSSTTQDRATRCSGPRAVNSLTSRGRTGSHASPPHARRERNHPRAFVGEPENPAGPTKPSTDGAGRHPSVTPGALTPERG